jgi:hypothetical protein
VLAHAKNGDEVFWEEKFHAANGKAQACTQGALLFFLLCFGGWGGAGGAGGAGGGGERFFFIFTRFPMCSHYVPFKFPMGSQYFPQNFLHTSSLLSHMPWKMVSSFHLYRWAKGEELYSSKWSLLFWGVSNVSFFWSDGPIKLARRQNKKKVKNLGGTSSNL